MPMETCKVCDKNSAILKFHNCHNCRLYCCRDCFLSHVGSCKYIKDEKISTCTFHQEQVEKYCFDCRQLICYKCINSGHRIHTILQLGVATSNFKLGIPNTETELAETDVMCLQNLDTYRRIQHDYKDIVSRIKEEETKWTSLISDISRSLVKPRNTNIELIETKCKGVAYTCEMIKDTKHQFRDLEIGKFPLYFLFKWSNAMKLKDKIDERSKGHVINKQIIERSELEKSKDMAEVFQNLVLNTAKMEGSLAETMDTPTAQFSEFRLKEPPSQTMSGRQFQDEENYGKDTPGNERYLKEQRCRELSKPSQYTNDLKPKIDIFEKRLAGFMVENQNMKPKIRNKIEESVSLKCQNERLREHIQSMSDEMANKIEESVSLKCQNERLREHIQNMSVEMANYQKEHAYMLDMLKSLLPDKMTQIDLANNKETLRFEGFPRQPNDFMNICTTEIEAIMIRYIKMKEDLLTATQHLYHKCHSVAEWTMEVNSKSGEEVKAYQEQSKKLQIYEKEIQSKDSEIHRLSSMIQELKRQYSTAEQQLYELQKSNQTLVQEVIKHQKELVDLQKRLSCVAEEKLTENNAAIMDLGDPNRPMRIGVKFGELYDSEWTNAIENISSVKKYFPDMIESEIQEIIIRHFHRLLKFCYRECLMKAEEQIHTLGATLAETMCLTFKSKDEITSLPVCREAAILRRATSEGFAKHLFQNQVLCKNIIADWDYINKNENVMQIFTQSMFFEKCVYLCWCMVIQEPVMHLDDDQVLNTQIDKNTYEEFDKSGDSVAYVVWPALFLHKDGPLLCKGVVQVYLKKGEDIDH